MDTLERQSLLTKTTKLKYIHTQFKRNETSIIAHNRPGKDR